jgi:hypothetical protein
MLAGTSPSGQEDTIAPGAKRAPDPVGSHACGTRKPRLGSRTATTSSGRPTVRKAELPSGTGWSNKRRPAAERQQETRTRQTLTSNGVLDNWPDTGRGCPARKGADVDQVSL